jgi:hypothetical protein
MLPGLLLSLALAAPSDSTLHRPDRVLPVHIPRQEAEPIIDGKLDDAPWAQAAVLSGFSQYAPSDGVPAEDSTEVLVWYSPSAIYFGIRAFEPHGGVHATLADRDKIFSDDNIQIVLGTFNDGRQATYFAVNPLGVQADGVLVETGTLSTGYGAAVQSRETPDLSPDYVFQSKGRVTDTGYEVEIRIPFKSLRYAPGHEQIWSLQVLRAVQHSGHEDTWTPVRRAAASFLAQSGQLEGLQDLKRGLVMDLTPEVTSKVNGAPGAPGGWDYAGGRPDLGGTMRWGVSNNLTLNATANPDFSQVESDAGQIQFDPRQPLFFDEKRPFFLDGSEQFQVPSNLIYTRRIVQPVAAVKLTGKVAGSDLALLSAVDDRGVSATGTDHPVYNILRLQRDLGRSSRLGIAYTDRIEGRDWNRVGDIDGRLVFGGVYSARLQLAGSRTHANGITKTAPLWQLAVNRNGHFFGLRTAFEGNGEDFRAGAGFLKRASIVHALAAPSVTFYGQRGGFMERVTAEVLVDGIWQYQHFVHGRGIQDRRLHLNGNAQFRGGWNLQGGLFIESFGYDSALYANYRLQVPRAGGAGLDTIPFAGQPTIPNFEGFVQVTTPQFASFNGSLFVLYGNDENFAEWASARIWWVQGNLSWRPTGKLRANFTYDQTIVIRRTDRTTVSNGRIPRLKLEYQLARPLFVRLVGQYVAEERDSLRDESRTNAPILFFNPESGTYARTAREVSNVFRGDLLVSYQPTPGTVLFAGYGSTLDEPRAFRFGDLVRREDGFFLKLSYLFRL